MTLLPMTLPMAMALCPLRAATTLVASSGSDVPPATMVRPITASLTPSSDATAVAPSTKRLLPTMRHAKPSTKNDIAFHTGICFASASPPSAVPFFAERTVYTMKAMNTRKSNAASRREMSPSRVMGMSIAEARTVKGMSFFTVERSIVIGATSAAVPTMSMVLKMLLPTTLPTARSVVPLSAEMKLMKNSGIDVPIATTVRPMTMGGMFILAASDVAPSVSFPAPQSTIIIPNTINIIFIITAAKL